MPVRIGVLALQGDFDAHRKALERAGAEASEVRSAEELERIDGLIIPGGESTTMLKLLDIEELFEPIRTFGSNHPIFGTCAGAILLASEVLNSQQASFGLMDFAVERNGYGRQIDSCIGEIEVAGRAQEAVFIRAPIIRRVGASINVLASFGGTPVLVEQGKHLAATFHPELGHNSCIHRYFLEKVTLEKEKRLASDTLKGK